MAETVNTPQATDLAAVQPMPPLTDEQLDALRTDIAHHGVLVPITVDQTGRILDGNNRAAIAKNLGIACPRVVVEVADDDAAIDIALTLNCARRQLTREQKRELVRTELVRRPDDSDRAIARRVGCSPSTVGAVRKPVEEVSKLDTPLSADERAQLVAAEATITAGLEDARGALYGLVGMALTNHVSVPEVVGALTMARLRFEQRPGQDPDVVEFYSRLVYDYVTQVTTWDATLEQFPPHPDSDPTPEERAMLIDAIVTMGDLHHPADTEGPVQ